MKSKQSGIAFMLRKSPSNLLPVLLQCGEPVSHMIGLLVVNHHEVFAQTTVAYFPLISLCFLQCERWESAASILEDWLETLPGPSNPQLLDALPRDRPGGSGHAVHT